MDLTGQKTCISNNGKIILWLYSGVMNGHNVRFYSLSLLGKFVLQTQPRIYSQALIIPFINTYLHTGKGNGQMNTVWISGCLPNIQQHYQNLACKHFVTAQFEIWQHPKSGIRRQRNVACTMSQLQQNQSCCSQHVPDSRHAVAVSIWHAVTSHWILYPFNSMILWSINLQVKPMVYSASYLSGTPRSSLWHLSESSGILQYPFNPAK